MEVAATFAFIQEAYDIITGWKGQTIMAVIRKRGHDIFVPAVKFIIDASERSDQLPSDLPRPNSTELAIRYQEYEMFLRLYMLPTKAIFEKSMLFDKPAECVTETTSEE